jgi:hypothetical protein
VRDESANPILKSTAQRKLRPEYFVFAENEKENTDTNAQRRQHIFIAVSRNAERSHARMLSRECHYMNEGDHFDKPITARQSPTTSHRL